MGLKGLSKHSLGINGLNKHSLGITGLKKTLGIKGFTKHSLMNFWIILLMKNKTVFSIPNTPDLNRDRNISNLSYCNQMHYIYI